MITIDLIKVLEILEKEEDRAVIANKIQELPMYNYTEAEWIEDKEKPGYILCSNCSQRFARHHNFCPFCGADMRKGKTGLISKEKLWEGLAGVTYYPNVEEIKHLIYSMQAETNEEEEQ